MSSLILKFTNVAMLAVACLALAIMLHGKETGRDDGRETMVLVPQDQVSVSTTIAASAITPAAP